MPPVPSDLTVRQRRARIAATARHHPEAREQLTAQRLALKAMRAEAYVKKLISEAPPLTPEQRDRLAVLLLDPATRVPA